MANRTSYEILIIGAGVIGSSIAFHLARAGAGRIAVLDRGTVCSGNTRKSGALIRMHYTNEPEARMALASLPYFKHWSDLVGGDCGFRESGFALLVGPENVERLHRNVTRLTRLGVNTRALTPDELRELQPTLRTDDLGAAAYEPDSGYADPVATTRAFAERARQLGAELCEDTAVTRILTAGDRVTGLETSRGAFEAPVVVCAANTWSPALLATAGVRLDLWYRRTQVAFYDRPPAFPAQQLVLIDTALGMYTRPEGAETVLGGMTAQTGPNPGDPNHYDEDVDPTYPTATRERLARRQPALADARFARGQAGLYDMSLDTRAVLDRASNVDGLYLAAGFSGTGFKKSPAVGACMAELILQGRAETVDLSPFRLSRFAEAQPL
nr:FAD-binding oxidoreductase [Chloroflexota bacterium]